MQVMTDETGIDGTDKNMQPYIIALKNNEIMSINPDNITTIRVDQLAQSPITLTSEIAHAVGSILKKKDTVQALVDLVAAAVGSGSGVGFYLFQLQTVNNYQTSPADPSFFLCGVGTF